MSQINESAITPIKFPSEWVASKLGYEVESIIGGGTPSKDVAAYWGGDIPWASVKDLKGTRLHRTQDYITSKAIENSATKLIPAGTLITPTRMALGKVAMFDCDVAINQDLKAIFPKTSLAKEYLLHWFQDNAERIEAAGTGSTVKGIRLETLREFSLLIPPLQEQQRIAAILTAVDDKLDVIARQIEATQTLKQGLLQTFFNKGIGSKSIDGRWTRHTEFVKVGSAKYPNSWRMWRMGDVAPIVRREVDVQPGENYPELGLRSFGKGTFHKPALTAEQVGSKRLFLIKAGDLLLSNVFAWEGAVAVAGPADDGRYGSHRYITCNVDPSLANVHFVARYLVTPAGLASIGLASPGGAGRNKTLGLAALADIQIPLPPLAEQNAINAVLECVEGKVAALQAKHELYRDLKCGLMQKLLTGEWRVKVDAELAA